MDKLIILEALRGNPPAGQLSRFQALLDRHVEIFTVLWWTVAFACFAYGVFRIVKPLRPRIYRPK